MFKKFIMLILIISGICDWLWCKAMIAFPGYAMLCYKFSGIKLLGGSFELYMKLCRLFTSISIPMSILAVVLLAVLVVNAKES